MNNNNWKVHLLALLMAIFIVVWFRNYKAHQVNTEVENEKVHNEK